MNPDMYQESKVARELAYNYSHMHYAHVKAMIALIAIGLENINKIFPDIAES